MTTVLQFSGGKDSLACLHLLRPRWDEITVLWCNTGAAFPETVELMREVRSMVPHFVEVAGKQTIPELGYPADVVPTLHTSVGALATGSSATKFQSRFSCCSAALWQPMMLASTLLGATTIIRGQKNSDPLRAPVSHGQVVDGIRYEFPLQGWTDDDVYAFLSEKSISLPRNYTTMGTSLDCWNCTAYLSENKTKLAYLRKFHPEKARVITNVLRDMDAAVRTESAPLKEIVDGL